MNKTMKNKQELINRVIDFYLTGHNLKAEESKAVFSLKDEYKAINYTPCCTELKACFQIGEKVILDNHTEVEVLVSEPKLYIRQNEYDSEMWVNMKRLRKKRKSN